jgi:hypothetical protein
MKNKLAPRVYPETFLKKIFTKGNVGGEELKWKIKKRKL